MHPVLVVGGGLAGLAAALRLAKAGHPVQLWEATDRLGGRVAPTPYPEIGTDDRLVDAAPAVIGFPAPWRDLFRKSGRVLDAELARTQAALVAAEPARYELADGTDLIFPTDRGEQYVTLRSRYGPGAAERWRDTLDWLDDVWQAVRPLGLEAELTDRAQVTRATRTLLEPRLTVADLADRMGHPALRAMMRASAYRQGAAPEQTPGWAAVPLSVERRFGRWTVTAADPDPKQRTGRTSTLVEALIERLKVRKVDVRIGHRVTHLAHGSDGIEIRTVDGTDARAAAVVFTGDPWQLTELLPGSALRQMRRNLRRLEPSLAPRVSHRLTDHATEGVHETVQLTDHGVPTVRYRRPVRDGTMESVHDFTVAQPDRSAGIRWRGFRSWFRRPPVSTDVPGLYFAGPHTAGGNGLSATVLAGALASYAAHDRTR